VPAIACDRARSFFAETPNTQTVLPFTGLGDPFAVAVDAAGNVYVADRDNYQVVKLAAG
jgi:serine/threonine-protein kinase